MFVFGQKRTSMHLPDKPRLSSPSSTPSTLGSLDSNNFLRCGSPYVLPRDMHSSFFKTMRAVALAVAGNLMRPTNPV